MKQESIRGRRPSSVTKPRLTSRCGEASTRRIARICEADLENVGTSERVREHRRRVTQYVEKTGARDILGTSLYVCGRCDAESVCLELLALRGWRRVSDSVSTTGFLCSKCVQDLKTLELSRSGVLTQDDKPRWGIDVLIDRLEAEGRLTVPREELERETVAD